MPLRLFLPLCGLMLLPGCPQPPDATPPDPGSPQATSQPSPDVAIGPWADIEKAIAAHEGKVVVVDLWSNTCAPCLREFPHLVELDEQYGDEVVCIAVNLDYYGAKTEPPESFHPAVVEYLTEQGARFENFLCSDATDDALAAAGATSMPTVLVYNREGALAKMFEEDGSYGDEGFSYAKHIGPLVAELVGSSN